MKKAISTLLCASLLTIASVSAAEELKVDISQPEAIKTALQSLTGKSVTITTGQGDSISGVVEAVGADAVKIKEISGKEFFSAVVKLSAVNSVVYRAKS